ncbi:MAG TPA: CHASE3 domain-containing protein [Burkholderiaceae bacterium]|jgi:signal transduction histidine kinase
MMPKKLLSRLRGSPFAFPLAALAALAMLVISESSYHQVASTFDGLEVHGRARLTIQQLWRSLTDAETGQRGYLLTGRAEYLKPYKAGEGQTEYALNWLNAYYADDARAVELMTRVTQATHAKMSELDTTLKLYAEGKTEAWHSLLLTNIGEEQMDTVRRLSEELLKLESERVTVARRSVSDALLLNRIGVSAMTALSLLALFMYLRQTSALVTQRDEQRRVVQAERDQLELEVTQRTDQLTELARHLQTAREDERSHLARELHDELGALLTAAKLDVARLKSRLREPTPEVVERIVHLNEALNSGIALKRRIIEDLRPSSLSNLGLVAALDILLTEWSARTDVRVVSALEPVKLLPSGELTIYRLVQEALTNISKYARATEVEVQLGAAGGVVRVSVRDNGAGFDVGKPRTSAHGLLGMRYRLESENGRMMLSSVPGMGTAIEAQLPESSLDSSPENRINA